jgi:hypothetical protein
MQVICELEKHQKVVQSTVARFETVIRLLQSASQKFRNGANEAATTAAIAIGAKGIGQLHARLKVECGQTRQRQYSLIAKFIRRPLVVCAIRCVIREVAKH